MTGAFERQGIGLKRAERQEIESTKVRAMGYGVSWKPVLTGIENELNEFHPGQRESGSENELIEFRSGQRNQTAALLFALPPRSVLLSSPCPAGSVSLVTGRR
jgi:hypothetical protein